MVATHITHVYRACYAFCGSDAGLRFALECESSDRNRSSHSIHSLTYSYLVTYCCYSLCCAQLYSSCLRVMCGRVEDRLDEICQTLQQALDVGCDTRSDFFPSVIHVQQNDPKVTEIADLLQMAGCPAADNA